MNQDYATQWLKLAGKSFAWVAGVVFVVSMVLFLYIETPHELDWWVPLVIAWDDCLYHSITTPLFTSLSIALRAFGSNQ